jgi:phosphate/phosphite/phosphonate ABC transporter binding protein
MKTNRREFLLMASLGIAGAMPAFSAQSDTFTFGLTPVFLTNDRELLGHIRDHLERQLGHPVKLVQRRTYQEITTMLLAGQLDAAWICGYPFVVNRDALSLVDVPVWRGGQLYQSYLIVPADRDANGLDDLRGDIHAFSDPDSNSGYLVTRTRLAEIGASPANFFTRSFFTYAHRNVVRAVASGLAQSGSIDGYVWEALKTAEPELVAKTKVIWRSDWLGFPPVTCLRERILEPKIMAFADALERMPDSAPGRAALELLQLDGFAPAEPALYDGIAELVASLATGRG